MNGRGGKQQFGWWQWIQHGLEKKKENHWGRPIWPLCMIVKNKVQITDRFPEFTLWNNTFFSVHVSCSCNLHVYQHFSTLPPQTQTLPPACHRKRKTNKRKKVMMNSDAEHLASCKDYAYKVNVQIQEIFTLRTFRESSNTYLTSSYN